jgi:hypothetical protein
LLPKRVSNDPVAVIWVLTLEDPSNEP